MKVFSPIALWLMAIPLTMCSKNNDEKPAPDLVKGLMAYYEFNQHLFDSTKNLPALAGAPAWNYGLDRNFNISSLNFVDGYLKVAVPNWKASPITFSFWVYAHHDNVSKYFLGTNNGSFGFFQHDKKLGMAVSHPYTKSAMADGLSDTAWTHLAGIFDGKKIYVYINGELKATEAHAGNPKDITELTLGSYNNSKWNGVLDDVRIYNRVLSAEEITLLASE